MNLARFTPPPVTAAIPNPAESPDTRRWPRHPVELPILIAAGDRSKTMIRGLATELSRCGMTFYAGVHLEEGDQMEVEFQTAQQVRLKGVVRNRNGYCFGVEFLAQLNGGSAPSQPEPRATVSRKGEIKKPASYASVCAELANAEDKLAARLQQKLESNADQNGPEMKRLCLNLLKIRELRRQIEGMRKTT